MEAQIAFAAPNYVAVLDLGAWSAVYRSNWGRTELRAESAQAKAAIRRSTAGKSIRYSALQQQLAMRLDASLLPHLRIHLAG
jgi:hypothetical protein